MSGRRVDFPELALPEGSLTRDAYVLRIEAVAEATQWEKGPSPASQIPHIVYESGQYSVALCKPGKEAPYDYTGCNHKDGTPTNNPNDMTPRVLVDGVAHEYLPTFVDVFEDLQNLHRCDELALDFVGCLLFRAALMRDYRRNEAGGLRWCPPSSVLEEVLSRIPTVHGLPADVWLHLVVALALNESVKYDTLGFPIKQGYGGETTLLTCAHIIAVFLGRASLAKFAGKFASKPRGVSPLPKTQGPKYFPMLAPRPLRIFR